MQANEQPLTVAEWMITILILAIPLVNIIMYLYWAFAGGVNLNRKRFCQASLIWFLILTGFGILFGIIAMLGGALAGF